MLDTFRVHRVEVGQVSVRAGAAEEPAALRVELQQLEDVDGAAGGRPATAGAVRADGLDGGPTRRRRPSTWPGCCCRSYKAARAVDYLPGSAQMQRLADAESGYQQARERYEREAR